MPQSKYSANHTGLIWIIPPGTIMAYFCPASVTLAGFVFYVLPILCVYFFLGRKVGGWLHLLESTKNQNGTDKSIIWYKYGFGLILLLPLVIFSSSPPPSAEELAQLKVHELVSAQTAIWTIRNIFSVCLSALAISLWGRYLPTTTR